MTTLDSATSKMQAIVRKTYQAFFSPSRYEEKSSDREVIERGNNYRLPFAGGELSVTTWGTTGPAILLMHGWGGARAQMTGFVDPLLSAGYRVIAYDQPAHGESDGRTTNLLEIAPSMDLIAEKEGPFQAVVAHSFGTLITSYALVERNFGACVLRRIGGHLGRQAFQQEREQRVRILIAENAARRGVQFHDSATGVDDYHRIDHAGEDGLQGDGRRDRSHIQDAIADQAPPPDDT